MVGDVLVELELQGQPHAGGHLTVGVQEDPQGQGGLAGGERHDRLVLDGQLHEQAGSVEVVLQADALCLAACLLPEGAGDAGCDPVDQLVAVADPPVQGGPANPEPIGQGLHVHALALLEHPASHLDGVAWGGPPEGGRLGGRAGHEERA